MRDSFLRAKKKWIRFLDEDKIMVKKIVQPGERLTHRRSVFTKAIIFSKLESMRILYSSQPPTFKLHVSTNKDPCIILGTQIIYLLPILLLAFDWHC